MVPNGLWRIQLGLRRNGYPLNKVTSNPHVLGRKSVEAKSNVTLQAGSRIIAAGLRLYTEQGTDIDIRSI